jgi:hypothetical protein
MATPRVRQFVSCTRCGENLCTHPTYHRHCPDCPHCQGTGLVAIPEGEPPDAPQQDSAS